MGLFSFLKKKTKKNDFTPKSEELSSSFNDFPDFPKKKDISPIEKQVPKKDLDIESVKKAVSPDPLLSKIEADLNNIYDKPEYIDEILDNDLNLDSEEIEFALQENSLFNKDSKKEINDEIQEKSDDLNNKKVEENKETTSLDQDSIKKDLPKYTDNQNKDLKNEKEDSEEEIHIEIIEDDVNSDSVFKPNKKDILKQESNIENKEIQNKSTYNKDYKIELPDKKSNDLELPDFEIKKETQPIVEESSQDKIIGDVFVKSTLYREALHASLVLKEDISICDKKIQNIQQKISSMSKEENKLKGYFESLQEDLLFIENTLFAKNPFSEVK
jgi:hypothetical protein